MLTAEEQKEATKDVSVDRLEDVSSITVYPGGVINRLLYFKIPKLKVIPEEPESLYPELSWDY